MKNIDLLGFINFFIICAAIVVATLFFVSCSKNLQKVNIAVPKECELKLVKPVEIKNETLQDILETITLLIQENNATKEQLKTIPCIKILPYEYK